MTDLISPSISELLNKAIPLREPMFDPNHRSAMRLFNGFIEGNPELCIDLYAKSLLIHNYSNPPEKGTETVLLALGFLKERFPWVQSAVVKERYGESQEKKSGVVIFGGPLDRKILENDIWYSIDLCMNRDASLYLDTRFLRDWMIKNLKGKTVLNTFAYTGSLGVAAMGAGASQVVHVEQNRKFLNCAKDSYSLNGFPIKKSDFLEGDFWAKVSHLKNKGTLFDAVILDPPFFATSEQGTVDLAQNCKQVINKIRPLVQNDGYLIVINNALFLSGKEFMSEIESLCQDGYLSVETMIPIPPDFAGFSGTEKSPFVTDPAPFNHSTKIIVLRVKRKSQTVKVRPDKE